MLVFFNHDGNLLRNLESDWVIIHVFVLHLGCSLDFFLVEDSVLIHLREHHANMLKAQSGSDHIDLRSAFLVLQLDATIEVIDLWWIVHSLNNGSHTLWDAGILAVVAIKVRHSLLGAAKLLPMRDKSLDLRKVHECNHVNVSEFLTIQINSLRDTLLALTLGEWWMVTLTIQVHRVSARTNEGTITTLGTWRMRLEALLPRILNHTVKRLMLWCA